jgi:hypothetical protein
MNIAFSLMSRLLLDGTSTRLEQTMNEQQAAKFTGRVLTDTAAAATTVLAAFGDRLGLFKDLADRGPATSAQLAGRTGLNERYVREWSPREPAGSPRNGTRTCWSSSGCRWCRGRPRSCAKAPASPTSAAAPARR